MAKMTLDQLQEQLTGLEKYQAKTQDELQAQAESLYKGQYEQNLKLLQDSIRQSVANQQRSALDTGMQRSSYNQAQQAIIRSRGLDAQAQLGTDYSTNVATTLLNLMNTEYDRENAANQYRNDLLMALYDYSNKGGGGGAAKKDDTTPANTPLDPEAGLNALFTGNNVASSSVTGQALHNYGLFYNNLYRQRNGLPALK